MKTLQLFCMELYSQVLEFFVTKSDIELLFMFDIIFLICVFIYTYYLFILTIKYNTPLTKITKNF